MTIKTFEESVNELKQDSECRMFTLAVDQSYKNSGIAASYGNPFWDGGRMDLVHVSSLDMASTKDKVDYRVSLASEVTQALMSCKEQVEEASLVIVLCERIRQFSRGFTSMPYIVQMGALIAYIEEAAHMHGLPLWTVDTRCWKSTVIGTSQPMLNSYNVPPEKFPTVDYVVKHGWKEHIFREVNPEYGERELKKKHPHNIFKSASGKFIQVDDDRADAICMSLFPSCAAKQGKSLDTLLKLV